MCSKTYAWYEQSDYQILKYAWSSISVYKLLQKLEMISCWFQKLS